jgi:acyl-CoA thioesterase FadM
VNLFVRLIKVVLAALMGSRIDIMDASVLIFRVWPNDLDFNMHMNNGRYLTLMDLGRTDLVIRCGLAGIILKRRWMPVLGGATVRFRRSLEPFQRFRLRTRILCWDEKWVFLEHRVETMDGRLAALAVVKGLFRTRAGSVTPAEVLQAIGRVSASPPMPEGVTNWTRTEKELYLSAEII